MTAKNSLADGFVRVVLADANILYSRVLRDYLLYAAVQGVLQIRWSRPILEEMVKHLIVNNARFDDASAERLIEAMNKAFPAAEVALDDNAMNAVQEFVLPDEDDRHVLAAAVATGADVLCTDNLKDFPQTVLDIVDIDAMSADELLVLLITEFPDAMREAHRLSVSSLTGATDETTINALRRAGAVTAAELVQRQLGASGS